MFGLLDSALLIATSIGAGLVGVVIADNDLTTVLVTLGAAATVILVGLSLGLRRTASARRPNAPMSRWSMPSARSRFSNPSRSPPSSGWSEGWSTETSPPDSCVISEGDPGREFFILLAGAADITIAGDLTGHLVAPASFGEIALLHDSSRTATVTTNESSRLAVIQRADFLEAIKQSTTSHRTALAVSQSYRR